MKAEIGCGGYPDICLKGFWMVDNGVAENLQRSHPNILGQVQEAANSCLMSIMFVKE